MTLLHIKCQTDAKCIIDTVQNCIIQMAYFLLEARFIDRTDLFQQNDGVLHQMIFAGIQSNVRRQLCLVHSWCNRRTDHCGTMAIAHVVLYDENRTDASLLWTDNRPQICKIYIASFNIQTISRSILINSHLICVSQTFVSYVPDRNPLERIRIWNVISIITRKWNRYTFVSICPINSTD